MNRQRHSDTVPASSVPPTPPNVERLPLEVQEEFEARSTWFHFQKWAELVAKDLDRTVDNLIHSFGRKGKSRHS